MRPLFLLVVSFICTLSGSAQGIRWQQVMDEGGGELLVYWFPNNSSIPDSKDVLDGVEQDLIYAFTDYLKEKYQIDLEVRLIETDTFDEVMETVREGVGGMMGASSISITEKRKEYLQFTPPYLQDIAVLVSNATLPVAHTEEEFKSIFKNATAITVENTTLIQALEDLDSARQLDLNFELVLNSGEILDRIGSVDNGFGYVDLPNLMDVTGKDHRVQRQYFYPIKLSGLALVFPLNSDWDAPINDYFTSDQFYRDKTEIITKYLGKDVEAMFAQLSRSAEFGPYEEIVISTRERELQFQELLEAARTDQEKNTRIFLLGSVTVIALISVIFFYARYQIKSRTNDLLLQQQQTIENRNQQLTRLNHEKNDLIEILAHDLRSPLSKIAGFSRLLSESKNIKAEDRELNSFIMKSSEKMESMILKILDVEAIESGKRNLKLERLDVAILGEEVINEMEDMAREKNIKIRRSDLRDCFVMGDRFYLRQIIENLLSNAIKYSPIGKVVEVSAKVEEDFVCIAVADQGPGIQEEARERLFNKYQTAATPTQGEVSTGLGLWIVKLFSEIMHGFVSFETEIDKGTTFYVRLPLAS